MYVYVMAGSDGWHKIGVSWDLYERRIMVSAQEPQRRPVTIARQYWVGSLLAYRIESTVHKRLAHRQRQGEWFQAPLRECVGEICHVLRSHGIWPRKAKKRKPDVGIRRYNAERDVDEVLGEGILWRRVF